MLIGYNNDVKYQGLTFHIQTEDRGSGNDQSVESQLFQGGQILDTRITPYADLVKNLDGEERDKKIRTIMQASHKGLFKKLRAGEYNEMVGLDPVDAVSEEINDADFTPSQERVPDAARLVEQEGEAAFHSPNMGDHVDLAALKSKLAGLAGTSELDPVSEQADDEAAVDNLFDDLKNSQTAPTSTKERLAAKKPKKRAAQQAEQHDDSDEPMTVVLDPKSLVGAIPKSTVQKATHVLESAKPAARSHAIEAARAAAARLASGQHNAHASQDLPLVEFEPTGQRAWTGCNAPNEDLSLLTLVEAFLHG